MSAKSECVEAFNEGNKQDTERLVSSMFHQKNLHPFRVCSDE